MLAAPSIERPDRMDPISWAIVAAFVVLRLVATVGAGIASYNDTPSYFVFRLWGAQRFPVVTALYAGLGNERAIVTVQAFFGAACWAIAGLVLGPLLANLRVRWGLLAATFALGLTLPVTSLDTALLSDSISLSLTVLLTALLLRLACRPSSRLTVVVAATASVWGFTRQSNAIMAAVLAVAVAVVGARRPHRRLAWPLAGCLLVVAAVGISMANANNTIQQYNVAQVLRHRILDEPAREQWFLDHGMPGTAHEIIARDAATALHPDGTLALVDDDVFGRWLDTEGSGTYARFLATHPIFVLTAPVTDHTVAGGFVAGTTDYGEPRRVLPRFIDALYWPHSKPALVGAALLAVAVATAVVRRARRTAAVPLGWVPGLALLAVNGANVVLVAHTAGEEYQRLLLGAATSTRLVVLWLLFAFFDDTSVTALGGSALDDPATPTMHSVHGGRG